MHATVFAEPIPNSEDLRIRVEVDLGEIYPKQAGAFYSGAIRALQESAENVYNQLVAAGKHDNARIFRVFLNNVTHTEQARTSRLETDLYCECDLRDRQWDGRGKCETCFRPYKPKPGFR